ncbi:histidine N-acetyltransferase-like [Centropristis striata]|uniref:histidine N-acetyltransferase-like n=1 Tax=Centropristis striata TaxID=184440 RepID=UPI0027E0A0A2|nr:histidine N-acetyltransferase-like [Centropristis striata]
MSAAEEAGGLVFRLAEQQDFQQVLNICSSDAFEGLDYMAATFHRWLQEPERLVFIALIEDRVVGLESALLVDGGHTAVFQGLRVAPDLRGRGVAGALQTHLTDHIRQHYPQVSAVRLSRGDRPPKQTLDQYRLVAKEAILSQCCEAADLALFVAELRSRLPWRSGSGSSPPVTLSQRRAEALILSDHVVSNLLPGGTIINDWEPLRPLEANLEVLRRRGLTWIVDRESEPAAVSLSTAPYAVPYRHDALHFNINIFGRRLASVCSVFLAQLEALLPRLRGYLIFYTYVDPAVWAGLRQLCHNSSNVSLFKDYWEELVLEKDL